MKRFNMATTMMMLPFLVLVMFGYAEAQQESLSAKGYSDRGVSYFKKGQYDQAIADYNRAIEINPKDAKAYNNRGIAYGEKGQYGLSIADFNKVLEISPRDADAYINRGHTYMKSGNKQKACSDWKRACELGLCANYDWAERNGVCQ